MISIIIGFAGPCSLLRRLAQICYPDVTPSMSAGYGEGQGKVARQVRIGVREVRALMPGEEIWDSAVRGFGARRRVTESVSYVLMYRTEEG